MGTINNFGNVLLPAGSTSIDVQSLLSSALAAQQAPLTLLSSSRPTCRFSPQPCRVSVVT